MAADRSPGTLGRAVRVAAAGLVLLAASACSPAVEDEPRGLTTEESQLLAVARFNNFDDGARSFSTSFTDSGHEISIEGWYDYRTGVGYASLADGGDPHSLITWQQHTLAVHAPEGGAAPLPPPGASSALDETWTAGQMSPSASTLHAVLILISELGSDRPENPLLLQQSGALWLREDAVGSVPVVVFSGPTGLADQGQSATAAPESRLRYWVDSTGTLWRTEALFGTRWVVVDFGPADDVVLDYAVAEAAG